MRTMTISTCLLWSSQFWWLHFFTTIACSCLICTHIHIKYQNGEQMWSLLVPDGLVRTLQNRLISWDSYVQQPLDGIAWKTKTSSELRFCRRVRTVDEKDQRRTDRLVQTDRKSPVAQITILYNCVERKRISEHITQLQMAYDNRRPHRVSLPSANHMSVATVTTNHQSWPVEDHKNVAYLCPIFDSPILVRYEFEIFFLSSSSASWHFLCKSIYCDGYCVLYIISWSFCPILIGTNGPHSDVTVSQP